LREFVDLYRFRSSLWVVTNDRWPRMRRRSHSSGRAWWGGTI